MKHRYAITRCPGNSLVEGISTAKLGLPDAALAKAQHNGYVRALEQAGLEVRVLPSLEEFPDSCFVEDTAVVTPKGAILTRPGAASRKDEPGHIRAALAEKMELVEITDPGTLDGGDILCIESHYIIGLSARTNAEGARQLTEYLARWGYTAETTDVTSYLHLKTGVNYVGDGYVLVTHALSNAPCFGKYKKLLVPKDEEYAANSICVNGHILTPRGFPVVRELLAIRNLPIVEVSMSEFQKVDGGLTCLSLLLPE